MASKPAQTLLRGLARLHRVRDCAIRDPAGNLLRMQQRRHPGNDRPH